MIAVLDQVQILDQQIVRGGACRASKSLMSWSASVIELAAFGKASGPLA